MCPPPGKAVGMRNQKQSLVSPLMAALFGLMLFTALLPGQTRVDLRTQSKSVDFTQAASTAPVKTGVAPPTVCAVGDLFYDTDELPGKNLYGCTSAGNWTL